MITPKTIQSAIIITALLAVGVAGLVAIVRARGKAADSFFRGTPAHRWLFIAGSLYAAVFWAAWMVVICLGVDGTSWSLMIAGAGIAAGLLAATFVASPADHGAEALTLAGTLESGPGSVTGFAVAGVLLASTLFLWIPLTLMIGSRILSAITGWDLMSCGLMIIVIPGLLTVAGGQAAVASTQLVAAVVTLAGLLPIALAGGAADARIVELQAGFGQIHWLVLLVGAGVNTFWFARGDHAMFQQIRGMAGTPALRKAGAAAGLLIILSAASFLAGSDLRLVSSDDGLRMKSGIVGAAVLTLAMASLSGYVMSASTLLSVDFSRLFRRHPEPRALVLSGRLVATATLIIAILAMSFVSLMDASGLTAMLSMLVAILVPVCATAVFGMLFRRGRGGRPVVAMLVGVIAASGALWAFPWGASDQERIVLASLSALMAVLAVMIVPVRSVQASTSDARDAGEFAGVRK
jgi:SSS family solute:Na+ symporter